MQNHLSQAEGWVEGPSADKSPSGSMRKTRKHNRRLLETDMVAVPVKFLGHLQRKGSELTPLLKARRHLRTEWKLK